MGAQGGGVLGEPRASTRWLVSGLSVFGSAEAVVILISEKLRLPGTVLFFRVRHAWTGFGVAFWHVFESCIVCRQGLHGEED